MALVVDPRNVGADWSWKIACRLSFKTKEWLKEHGDILEGGF